MGLKTDSHNFIRDVKIRLDAWGYDYETPRGGAVIITRKPETAQERLAEIMIRRFNLDIQIEVCDFACYLHFMLNEPAAQTMPWGTRHAMIQEMYGLDIAEITLRRWTKRLKDEDIISQSEGRQSSEWWITYRVDGEKHQEPVEEADLPAVHNYWKRHAEVSATFGTEARARRTEGTYASVSLTSWARVSQAAYMSSRRFLRLSNSFCLARAFSWSSQISPSPSAV